MTPEEICRSAPRLLSPAVRQKYFDEGGVAVPDVVGADWLARCRDAVARLKAQSAALNRSNSASTSGVTCSGSRLPSAGTGK